MEPSRDPLNFQDWSVWRNFHEAARLMTTHFHVFLPSLVFLLFPGSLVWVAYCQFLDGSFQQLRGGWLLSPILVGVCSGFLDVLVVCASYKVLDEIKTTVYVLDADMYRNGESNQVQPGRRFRAVVVSIVCFLVFMLGEMVPMAFGFTAVAAMGLPEWTTALFTPLLVAGNSFLNLYLVLVTNLVVRLWMYAGQSASASMV